MPKFGRRRVALLGVIAVLVATGVGWAIWGDSSLMRAVIERPGSGHCDRRLTRALLDQSLAMGTKYLLRHQTKEGNFDYEYDWQSRARSSEDDEVRQAGVLWGLTLLYLEQPSPELELAIKKGLGFFEQHSRLGRDETRCIAYSDAKLGDTGTVALLALSYIEYLRAPSKTLSPEELDLMQQRLGEYLKTLVGAVNKIGLFYGRLQVNGCKPSGEHSPYYDGESLLALVKAAKYADHPELEGVIRRAAKAGRAVNVDDALEEDTDSDVTKGYYQWSSMAFFELATSGWSQTGVYGDTVLRLADWMIDEHHVLLRSKNTGYAFEGLTHAYELARQRKDSARLAKYGCVIDVGLERMMAWQVGGPLANRFTRNAAADDPGLGGVQNAADEPALRVDVTGHQMHATLLARRYVYPPLR